MKVRRLLNQSTCTCLMTLLCLMPVTRLASAQTPPARPAISIVSFDTDRTGWMPPPNFGETVADLLADRLVDLGQFRVMDREWLPPNNMRTGRRAPMEVLRIAAYRAGVEFLVVGAVTRFTHEESKDRAGLLAVPVGLGIVGKNKKESSIGLTIRVIDARTGEIVAATTATANAAKKKTSGGGAALVHGVPIVAGVSHASTGIGDALLDEALQRVVSEAGQAIGRSAARMVAGDVNAVLLSPAQSSDAQP